jgi:hypothetical protein
VSVYGCPIYVDLLQQSARIIAALEDSQKNHPELSDQTQRAIGQLRIRERLLLQALFVYLDQAFPDKPPVPKMRIAIHSV